MNNDLNPSNVFDDLSRIDHDDKKEADQDKIVQNLDDSEKELLSVECVEVVLEVDEEGDVTLNVASDQGDNNNQTSWDYMDDTGIELEDHSSTLSSASSSLSSNDSQIIIDEEEEFEETIGGRVCPACKHRCDSSHSLYYHLKVHHPDEKVYRCPRCSLGFSRRRELNTHLTTHLSSVLRFECGQCGKRFAQSSHLSRHRQTHSEVKRHVCGHCDKRFRRSDHLAGHVQRMHTSVKRFSCAHCPASFAIKQDFKRHIARRHPYSTII